MTDSVRAGELGIVRGCCAGIVLLLAVLGFIAFLIDRAVASPDLGPPPGGRDDGDSQLAIATTLGARLAGELIAQPHGVVTLSEHDLTILAQEHNPHPDRYRDVLARVRDGLVDVSADTSFGPLNLTVVARVGVALEGAGATQQLAAHVNRFDVGALQVPGWLQEHIIGSPVISLDQLFSNPALRALRANIECVTVASDGVRIGVHRPLTAGDSRVCSGS